MKLISRQRSLKELALAQLRDAIVDGTFAFGTLLSEGVLAQRLGISKAPIHEAIVQLQTEGLVDILPQRGAMVFSPTAEAVTQLCEFRILLEVEALRLAVAREGSALTDALGRTVERMDRARARGDIAAYMRLDADYHQYLYRLCGNPHIATAYSRIEGRVAALRTKTAAPNLEARAQSFEDHRVIFDRLAAGELEAAVEILRDHIRRTEPLFTQAISAVASPARRRRAAKTA